MRILTATLFYLLAAQVLLAQPKENSPYSRYGLGDPLNQFFAVQAAQGGQTMAFHDPFHLNLVNPASYAFLRATTFDVGIYTKASQYKSATDERNGWTGNLAYLALGFPLKSPINAVLDKIKSPWQYGMGVALTPYSLVGYNLETLDDQTLSDTVSSTFQGSGGTYRFTWSNAVKYKQTAIGLNLGWQFGKASYEATTDFDDPNNLPTFQDNRRDQLQIHGFVWNFGIQHDLVLQHAENDATVPLRWITFGLTAESSHRLRVGAEQLLVRSRGQLSNGNFSEADTLLFEPETLRDLTLPGGFGIGIQYVDSRKFRLGGQFEFQNWENYDNEARPETLRNTISISAGGEYTPDNSSYNNYWRRVRLRLGAYYRQDPRLPKGENLDDVGLSFGFGFPIVLPRQQTSFVNTAFELGKLGTHSPIEETYARITVGFTLNDNTWFFKRRFE